MLANKHGYEYDSRRAGKDRKRTEWRMTYAASVQIIVDCDHEYSTDSENAYYY